MAQDLPARFELLPKSTQILAVALTPILPWRVGESGTVKMEVIFKSSQEFVYEYEPVPAAIAEGIFTAESAGRYLSANVSRNKERGIVATKIPLVLEPKP